MPFDPLSHALCPLETGWTFGRVEVEMRAPEPRFVRITLHEEAGGTPDGCLWMQGLGYGGTPAMQTAASRLDALLGTDRPLQVAFGARPGWRLPAGAPDLDEGNDLLLVALSGLTTTALVHVEVGTDWFRVASDDADAQRRAALAPRLPRAITWVRQMGLDRIRFTLGPELVLSDRSAQERAALGRRLAEG